MKAGSGWVVGGVRPAPINRPGSCAHSFGLVSPNEFASTRKLNTDSLRITLRRGQVDIPKEMQVKMAGSNTVLGWRTTLKKKWTVSSHETVVCESHIPA